MNGRIKEKKNIYIYIITFIFNRKNQYSDKST